MARACAWSYLGCNVLSKTQLLIIKLWCLLWFDKCVQLALVLSFLVLVSAYLQILSVSDMEGLERVIERKSPRDLYAPFEMLSFWRQAEPTIWCLTLNVVIIILPRRIVDAKTCASITKIRPHGSGYQNRTYSLALHLKSLRARQWFWKAHWFFCLLFPFTVICIVFTSH